jgi:transposase-like protein
MVGMKRRKYSAEFKAGGSEAGAGGGAADEQGCGGAGGAPEGCMYTWVNQARVDRGKGPKGALTTAPTPPIRVPKASIGALEKTAIAP